MSGVKFEEWKKEMEKICPVCANPIYIHYNERPCNQPTTILEDLDAIDAIMAEPE